MRICPNNCPKIGEVYLVEFDGAESTQRGLRPGLIIQNNVGNAHSPNVIVVPFTTSLKKLEQPTHVLVKSEDSGLKKDSLILCENPVSVPKSNIHNYITTIPNSYMEECAIALAYSMPMISYLSKEKLISIWHKASTLSVAI